MRHNTFQQNLARRHELSGAEEAALRDHIARCGDCRQREAEYLAQEALLSAFDQPPVLAALRQAVLQKTLASQPPPGRPFFPRWAAVPAAAACLVLIAVAGGLLAGGLPFGQRPHMLSSSEAVQRALVHSVAASYRSLPKTVRVHARLGAYHGVAPAWLVTVSGPGVSILPPTAAAGQPPGLQVGALLHRETVVIDGRSGSYIETSVSTE